MRNTDITHQSHSERNIIQMETGIEKLLNTMK